VPPLGDGFLLRAPLERHAQEQETHDYEEDADEGGRRHRDAGERQALGLLAAEDTTCRASAYRASGDAAEKRSTARSCVHGTIPPQAV